MSNHAQDRVVVGVDSPFVHQPIVDLAVTEARRLRTGVTIIHVILEPTAYGLAPWAVGLEGAVRDAGAALEELAAGVRDKNPDVDVQAVVRVGFPAATLIDLSRSATLIVLGCRGLGGFAELLLGSVSSQVAAHAHSPVIVVRPADAQTADTGSPVLVGVDGSPANDAAIGFAFAEAAQRGTRLIAQHYWSPVPTLVFVDEYTQAQLDQDAETARVLLTEALAKWQEKFPDVLVEQRLTLDANPEDAFIQSSMEASLVVVGSRGRGGFTGLLLGSVSQALLHHAHCPVAVVR